MHGTEKPAPAAADLARREPIALGTTRIVPATREIHGPSGVAVVQPRVMHVLLALADARGAVVTRDDLARSCWGGRFVAEDSLNGAIAELRKALRSVCGGEVSVETVPKTGYRLVGPELRPAGAAPVAQSPPPGLPQERAGAGRTRRMVLAGGIVALAAAGWAGWRAMRPAGGEADLLIEQGAQALRQGLPDAGAQGVEAFTKAVAIEPENAKGWGMLALAWRASAEYGGPDEAASARAKAEMAAKRALAIDPRQSDALTALATITPAFGHWTEAERRVRDVLAIDPENRFAVAALATLLMSTGQVRACLRRLDWLHARDPLSPNLQFRRVYTLWSAGRLKEMDRTADWALQTWPLHPAVWFARLWTLAFTDRAEVARAMLADEAARPPMPAAAVEVLDLSLKALAGRRPADMERAKAANLQAAVRGPSQAVPAIMVLSSLGLADSAYQVAEGFLLRKGPLVVQLRHTPAQPSVTDLHHRITMMLWIPATEALRLHRDFRSLCDGIGLLDYWKATGTRPDFRRGGLATI